MNNKRIVECPAIEICNLFYNLVHYGDVTGIAVKKLPSGNYSVTWECADDEYD